MLLLVPPWTVGRFLNGCCDSSQSFSLCMLRSHSYGTLSCDQLRGFSHRVLLPQWLPNWSTWFWCFLTILWWVGVLLKYSLCNQCIPPPYTFFPMVFESSNEAPLLCMCGGNVHFVGVPMHSCTFHCPLTGAKTHFPFFSLPFIF